MISLKISPFDKGGLRGIFRRVDIGAPSLSFPPPIKTFEGRLQRESRVTVIPNEREESFCVPHVSREKDFSLQRLCRNSKNG
jgi:hypothetical protein